MIRFEAMSLADWISVMNAGAIVSGKPNPVEVLPQPAARFARQFQSAHRR